MIKTWRKWGATLLLGLGLGIGAHAQSEPLRIGVIPYLTPSVLMALFQPVRLQLEKDLGRPVELFTSPDVRSFARRTLSPDFDLIITAAHQARLAQVDGGYLPLARFTGPLHAAIVVAKNASIQHLDELKGKTIALTDRSILVNIAMTKILADQGLRERDLHYLAVNSQNTGILAVARGDADAAIIAHFTLDQSPEEQRKAVRPLFRSEALPNITILARANLPADLREACRRSLLALPSNPEGSAFLEKSRFIGIHPADEAFMKTLDPYLPETRKQLGL